MTNISSTTMKGSDRTSSFWSQHVRSAAGSLFNRTTIMLMMLFLLAVPVDNVNGSHQSINIDQMGNYRGIVIGFSNNFQSFEQQYINTTLLSIMNQLQKTSNILKQLIGVQLTDVTIILPDKWNINPVDLQSSFNVDQSNEFRSLADADILFTNDDKSQILTMQYGDCGEGALPINFPIHYVSDENSARLMAHQWIMYRYGVYNEFGLEDDPNYPVYYTTPDGGLVLNDNSKKNILNTVRKPEITSCYQGETANFIYSNNCNNATDPNTGRPINPNCDVIPAKKTIQSSFMYAPIAVSELQLCNSTTHDYQSPTKHNIICDYHSIQDVIAKHPDFERFKPTFNVEQTNLTQFQSNIPIKFHILQNRNILNDYSSPKAHVFYALPKHRSKFLETSMDTIKKQGTSFPHQAFFALYGDQLDVVSSKWQPSSLLSTLFLDNDDNKPEKINLNLIFNAILQQFTNITTGTCVLFFDGDMNLDNTDIDYVEHLADLLSKKNIGLRVIIYDRTPSNEVLKFFDQLSSKMTTKSSVEYAFGQVDSSSHTTIAFRTQLVSIISTLLFDILQDITDRTQMLIKRETFRSNDPAGIEFTIDPTISNNNNVYHVLIEMTTNGKGSDLALGFHLIDSYRKIIPDVTFETYQKSVVIQYGQIKPGVYRFNFRSTDPDTFITISVRVISKQNPFDSYKDAQVSARCWIQSSPVYPLRVYVQVSQGLNGPVYDSDVTFVARAFSKNQQKNENTFPLNDNGRGNPDITAHDGIYSAYLDPIFTDNSGSYAQAYTITARIASHRISMKPGNFGNTVLYNFKPRCCGTELKTNGDVIVDHRFERIVHCGSFYYSLQNNRLTNNNYAIRDLRIVHVDPDNRTISLEWSSPFYSMDQNKPIIIKAFHSYSRHSRLPLDISEGFDREQNEAELEVLSNNNNNNNNNNNYNNNNNSNDIDDENQSVLYETIPVLGGSSSSSSSSSSFSSRRARYDGNSKSASTTTVTNSLRQVSIKILSPEEGYYLVAVKERNDENESKPSNIATVYLKSNVLVENSSALAIDNSRLSAGPNRSGRPLPWVQILAICIICALILFIIILIIICFTIRRYRKQTKDKENQDFKTSMDSNTAKKSNGLIADKVDGPSTTSPPTKTYYSTTTSQDGGNNLISNPYDERLMPNSSASNHTSCSSVNTVENTNPYMNGHQHLEHPPSLPAQSTNNNGAQLMKELNVATLLPNSWDAKDLLDHWGRVQEAKLRQESPPINTNPQQQSNSPSMLSYGGSSSLENNNNYHQQQQQQQQQSFLFQPAIVQPNYGPTSQQPSQQHQHYAPHQNHHGNPLEYPSQQQPQQSSTSSSIYSPYSNASSIWQHHHQQQQQQQQQQHIPFGGRLYDPHIPKQPLPLPQQQSLSNMSNSNINYDDNGLPEYSVVRKFPPNISQV